MKLDEMPELNHNDPMLNQTKNIGLPWNLDHPFKNQKKMPEALTHPLLLEIYRPRDIGALARSVSSRL